MGRKGRLGGQPHMAARASEASPKDAKPLNKDKIEQMGSFLSRSEKPTCTSSLAYSGTFPFLFGEFPFSFGPIASYLPFKQYWILDSGATDHMTPLPTHFSTYSPCSSNKKNIYNRHGTLITVAGQWDVQLNPFMTLNNVLHIPKLSTSLISIQKLTKDLSCNVILNNKSCVFQDKESGRTTGNAREWNGLYYLDNQVENHVNVEADVSYGKNIMIYTRRKTIPESTHIQENLIRHYMS
uniref:Gag-pol polyprotein-related n=1 Tax=Medicago truncatula TaxID=3880 RepID=Q2HT51_MEDTR|nr:gag-pol polyprotein-related [Medicago truncatula]